MPDNPPHVQREPGLAIAQVAERTGLTTDTLRYYERAGLIDGVERTSGNQRRYTAADVAWLDFLLRLRETGMPIRSVRRYARLRAQGQRTVEERLDMLREHRAELAGRLARLHRHSDALAAKIAHYEGLRDSQPGTDMP